MSETHAANLPLAEGEAVIVQAESSGSSATETVAAAESAVALAGATAALAEVEAATVVAQHTAEVRGNSDDITWLKEQARIQSEQVAALQMSISELVSRLPMLIAEEAQTATLETLEALTPEPSSEEATATAEPAEIMTTVTQETETDNPSSTVTVHASESAVESPALVSSAVEAAVESHAENPGRKSRHTFL